MEWRKLVEWLSDAEPEVVGPSMFPFAGRAVRVSTGAEEAISGAFVIRDLCWMGEVVGRILSNGEASPEYWVALDLAGVEELLRRLDAEPFVQRRDSEVVREARRTIASLMLQVSRLETLVETTAAGLDGIERSTPGVGAGTLARALRDCARAA